MKYTGAKSEADAAGATFSGVGDAFTLSGHKAAVCHVEWSADSCKIATLSRDATWRVYDVAEANQHFARGASPVLLLSGAHSFVSEPLVRAAFAPDGLTLAVGGDTRLELYDVDGDSERVPPVHFGADAGGGVGTLAFSRDGKFVLAAVGRHVYALHNVLGARVRVASIERRRNETKNANVRERLAGDVQKAQQELAALEQKLKQLEQKKGPESES